jgi:hypothetical protein
MADHGIAHVMLTEQDCLNNALYDYDLIVVPYLPLISQNVQAQLVRYAKKGGILLLLGECGTKNEYNVTHEDIVLLNLLGGKTYPKRTVDRRVGSGTVSFIPLDIPPHRFLISIPAQGDGTTFGPSMADLFPDIPEGYTRNRMDRGLRRILDLTVKKSELLLSSNVHVVHGSSFVEMTTMMNRSAKSMLFHLVNYDVTIEGTITPAKNMTIQVLIPEGQNIKEIKYSGSLSELQSLPFKEVERRGERLVVLELETVEIYGLGVILFR